MWSGLSTDKMANLPAYQPYPPTHLPAGIPTDVPISQPTKLATYLLTNRLMYPSNHPSIHWPVEILKSSTYIHKLANIVCSGWLVHWKLTTKLQIILMCTKKWVYHWLLHMFTQEDWLRSSIGWFQIHCKKNNSLDFRDDPSLLSHTDRSLAVGTEIKTEEKSKIQTE